MDAEDIAFAGANRQVELLRLRELSARELVAGYLERIEHHNPALNAYRVVFAERALVEADAVQQRIDAGEDLPLLGVPVAIKDDADVAGEVTTQGTLAHGPAPEVDGPMVRRLREAGAIVIGKTHVPALMHSPYTESVAFGATRNPWALDRTPGGSSGGSAAALAAGLCGLASGSDGGGSIRIPSTWCGLFGIKPQRGRVSNAPYDDGWQGMSQTGPIARTVADAARFLDATTELPAPPGGFLAAAQRPPDPLKIAVSTKLPPGVMAPLGAAQRRAMEETVTLLRSLGHEVIERDPDYAGDLALSTVTRIMRGIHDGGAAMARPELIDARVRGLMRAGGLIPDALVRRARAAEAQQAERIAALFDDVQVLLTPACLQGPYVIGAHAGVGALKWMAIASSRIAYFPAFNATGQPACTVPAGLDDDGLPMSVQLVSRAADEATLLSLSAQLELERPWAYRRPAL